MHPDTTQWQPHEKDNICPFYVWLYVVNSCQDHRAYVKFMSNNANTIEVMFYVNNLW